jgi:hypothetical protein
MKKTITLTKINAKRDYKELLSIFSEEKVRYKSGKRYPK